MLHRKLTRQVFGADGADPVVETAEGMLRGLRIEGISCFRGIRYAKAKRFALAEPVDPWEGIQDARVNGAVSPELNPGIPSDELLCPHTYWRSSEHCQNLNLWTPSTEQSAGLPVIVWMHGGGWVSGSCIEQDCYDGLALAKKGNLVVIGFNSRQNCFGALDLSSFGGDFADSVYCGISDTLAALRWIRRNIRAFGGDPNNVTIVGQAGGAKRALAILQTPAADGLYQKMAIGSCAGEKMEIPEGWTRRRIAQRMGELTAEELGLDANTIGEIRRIPCERLMDAVRVCIPKIAREVPGKFRWEPIADNVHLYGDPFHVGFRPETVGIPMMSGTSFGEMWTNARHRIGDGRKNGWAGETTVSYIEKEFGAGSKKLLEAFRHAYPGHPDADLLFIDRSMRNRLNRLTMERARMGGKIWNWQFDLEFPFDGGLVSWHCSENPFILCNTEYMEASWIPGVSEQLQEQMSDAWIAFAHRGDPNCASLPDWPQAAADSLPTMCFGKETRLNTDYDRELQMMFSAM